MGRVALLMLDGAERELVLQLAHDGELPVIASLLAAGVLAPTRTPVAYRAEFACTELLTGRSAEDLRYWGTVVFEPSTYRCATIGSARRRPFYAHDPAGPVIVFDMPHSVLVDDLPGVQVVGWGGHDARFQHPRASKPADLMDEIDRRFGPDPTNDVEYTGGWHQDWYVNRLADALIASAERRADIACWLMRRTPDWQLLLVGLTEPHSAGHNLSQGIDPDHLLGTHPTAALARQRFVEVYRALDGTVAAVAAAVPPGTMLAVSSTKGMQPNRDDLASSLLLPELVHRLVFGSALVDEPSARSWARRGHPPVWPDPRTRTGARTSALRAEGRWAGVKRRYHTLAPAPLVRSVQSARRRVTGAPAPPRRPSALLETTPDGDTPVLAGDLHWSPATWYQRHWPAMPWFALPSFSDGHIRLNLRGRERDGVVAPEAYERTCDELEAELRRATDPRTGQSIVDEVIRLRTEDPMAADGPGADLVVTWALPVDALEHPRAGLVGPFAFPRSGSHTDNGFLIVAGPGIDPASLGERPALDVPPTLLALLGWSVPADLGGRAIDELVPSSAADR